VEVASVDEAGAGYIADSRMTGKASVRLIVGRFLEHVPP
jgi:hypothetical protein